jgi:hypothetical protein
VDEHVVFVAFSRVLTGIDGLAAHLATVHLARVQADATAAALLPELLTRFTALDPTAPDFAAAFGRALFSHDEVGALSRRILVLWYTGAWYSGPWPAVDASLLDYSDKDPSAYFGALMWSAIGAHPPGLSGGYLGYWRYPPEN